MARTGPVTKDTSTVALGLAQIRVGRYKDNVSSDIPVLGPEDSIGALAMTKLTNEVAYWKLESGFPKLEDLTIPLSESARLECQFKEITPANLALAKGLDPEKFKGDNHTGTIALGTVKEPERVRMEAVYTFPNGVNTLTIIFPAAQVTSSTELDFQAEDNANPPITFEAKRADSETATGNVVWDDKPLGVIIFA